MQYIDIQGRAFSRVVCGSNPFYGRSHFSEARSAEYQERFTDAEIRRVLELCRKRGINAVESSANERMRQILRESPVLGDMQWIGSTRIDDTSPVKSHSQKLALLIEQRAPICLIHAQLADRPPVNQAIPGLRRMIDSIHEAGLLAGISTHRVATVEFCETHNYGIDVYLFPFNRTGFVYPGFEGQDTVAERARIIRDCPKPFILMKTLGAGRIPPEEGLAYALEHAKPNDLISLGLGSVAETEESLRLVEGLIERIPHSPAVS